MHKKKFHHIPSIPKYSKVWYALADRNFSNTNSGHKFVATTLVVNHKAVKYVWGYVFAILRKRGFLNTCQGFLSWEASRGASFELIKSPTDTPKSLVDDNRGAWKMAENLIFRIKNIEIQYPSLPPSHSKGCKVVKGQFQATLLVVHTTVVGDIIFKLPFSRTGELQFDTDAFAVWILNSIDDRAIAIGKIKGVESNGRGCIL